MGNDSREAIREALAGRVFDCVIIGGGINGAAAARDATLRGLSVAVIEMQDLAAGTSSRSSKLIHGGVRYLQQGDVGLVLEACRERDLLRTTLAPHLVRAQRFVFPIYKGDDVPGWQLAAGLMLYDMLAGFRNVKRHELLSVEELCRHEPALATEQLQGGAFYYDCWTDDARLTLELALDARDNGAVVLTHAAVTALEKDSSGNLSAAVVRDRLSGSTVTVRGRAFVNVTGPWLDRIRALDDADAPPRLRLTKGVHAVFDRQRIGNNDAIVIRGADGRVMFAIPWQNQTLVGTTDTDYDGDPADVSTGPEDVEYVLDAVNRSFPSADVTARDIVGTYAGLRPLVAPEDDQSESDVSRDDQIFESPSGLISLGGGKLTTHRHVAERIIDRVVPRVGRDVGGSRTAETPLPGASGVDPGEASEVAPASFEDHVRLRYGASAPLLLERAEADPRLAERLVADLPDARAELLHAVDRELAATLEDVLARRLQVAYRSRLGTESVVREAARLIGEHLGWTDRRIETEVADYLARRASDNPWLGALGESDATES